MTKRCLIISGAVGPSHLYRADQLRKSLEILGYTTSITHLNDPVDIVALVDRAENNSLVIFVRCPLVGPVAEALSVAKRRDFAVIADFDDLIFRTDIFSPAYMDGISYLSGDEQSAYYQGIRDYRAMVQAVDGVLVSTNSLADEVLEAGGSAVWVVPNVFNYSTEALARHLRFIRWGLRSDQVVIGYASGTLTHQRDFEEARDALVEVLRRSPSAKLLIVGEFDPCRLSMPRDIMQQVELDSRLRTLGEMPYIYARFDVAIAPLQRNNPFTDAKSNLKFLDAALVGCPTVASPTRTYAELSDGHEILLAGNSEEWINALMTLIDASSRRKAVADAALERVGRDFSPSSHVTLVKNALEGLASHRSRQRIVKRSSIPLPLNQRGGSVLSWILPEPDPGSGGARSVFRLAANAREFGIGSTVYLSPTGAGTYGAELLSEEFGVPVSDDLTGISSGSRLVATQWTTALFAVNAVETPYRPIYFIQDYEPLFYPMSYEYVKAESTYRLPFHHVYYGPWVGRRVGGSPKGKSLSLPFPVEGEYRTPIAASEFRAPRDIAWLARPGMDRRCHGFALEVLGAVLSDAPDVRIHTFGSHELGAEVTGFHHHGVLDAPALATLYRRVSVGVSISTTNPSAIPYEMVSCGCVPVDLDNEVSRTTYQGMSDVPLLLDLDPYLASRQILTLLEDERDLARRRKKALAVAPTLPSVRQISRKFANFIKSLNK
jgi:glycosyltransferase involved in cell wall biosynthesis